MWTEFNFCKTFHCLPYRGGMFEQPARIIQIFSIIEGIILEKQNTDKMSMERDMRLQRLKNGR